MLKTDWCKHHFNPFVRNACCIFRTGTNGSQTKMPITRNSTRNCNDWQGADLTGHWYIINMFVMKNTEDTIEKKNMSTGHDHCIQMYLYITRHSVQPADFLETHQLHVGI